MSAPTMSRLRSYLITLFACVLVAATLLPWHGQLAPVNTAMLLLLPVAFVAAYLGRGPGIFASALCVIAFDLGFVAPRGSLSVEDSEYLIVFAVMLMVALIISQISGSLRRRQLHAQTNETLQRRMYELAAELNASLRSDQVVAIVSSFLRNELDAEIAFHPPAASDTAAGASPTARDPLLWTVETTAQPAYDNDGPTQRPHRHVQPLLGATRMRGLLEIRLPLTASAGGREPAAIIELVAGLMAAALERLHYLEVAARVQGEVESERLRNALLSSLSHDLRTPLTVLYGQADRLREHSAKEPALERQAARVCEEALRVSRLSEGLLDLARVRTTPDLLRREWVALEELIGSALAGLRGVAGIDQLRIEVPADLPWLQLDASMFERVIANLVDNALKQGDDRQQVSIVARAQADGVGLIVANTGSRFPDRACDLMDSPAATRGFGLGLSICKAVVEAHGGRILLRNSALAAEVMVTLPVPTQTMSRPPLDVEDTGASA